MNIKKGYKVKYHPFQQSLRMKLVLTLVSLLLFTIFACWMMNKTFLPSYYQYSKVKKLSHSYMEMNEIASNDKNFKEAKEDGLSDKSTLSMEILAANSSMSLYMFEISNFFGKLYYTFDYPSTSSMSDMQANNVKEKTAPYVLAMMTGNLEMSGRVAISKHKKYVVYKVYDERIGSYYLELFGQLDTESFVYMRTNYQSMKENVAISNRFLAYIGFLAALIGAILMMILSNSFVKPILHMTDIAKRMSQLDFEAKYPVTTKDEVGKLGNSINTLSEKLEETISQLKTANNELQRDIEQKIQIDEMRKDFLSNVSHELKTPIALIQGYAEGLQDNINDDSEGREFYCNVIIDEANKMNKMVKKLLTLNEIEFGNSQVNFERFDIVQVIRSVIQSATLLAEQKEAVITFLNTEPLYVWADEYHIEEVVTNYVSNAINHVSGEKNIIVRLEEKEKVVRICVYNTGQPIPEEDIDKVWIKFYKVDKARTRAYGGSGIGLSIVKAIMDSMNQQCGVCNKDQGVEFWFELDRTI